LINETQLDFFLGPLQGVGRYLRENLSAGLRDKTTLNLQNESDGSSRDHDEETIDCIKDRKNALEDKSVSRDSEAD
jgi:hypothetical protein